MCHQSVGLLQNIIEGRGIVTVSLTLKPELTEQVRVPRAAYVRFPYGNAVGRPCEPEEQKSILRDCLRLVEQVQTPGRIARLPYRWRLSVRLGTAGEPQEG